MKDESGSIRTSIQGPRGGQVAAAGEFGGGVGGPRSGQSEIERAQLLCVANEPRFAAVPPARIVPMLADEGVYLASESSFARVLRAHGQSTHRGRAKEPHAVRPPTTHIATAPRQVWCWDMTYLPTTVMGRWFYLYLILDLYSRKIVGWEVHQSDNSDHAAHLVRRTALAEGIAAVTNKRVLHGDTGSTLKATTVLAMLNWLGVKPSYLRPRVSDDNAFAESLFRTAKYRPEFQALGFADLDAARAWAVGFVHWYNQHRSSTQRHPPRQPGAATCRRRSRHPGGPSRAVPQGSRTPPGAMGGQHARRVAHRRRDAQPQTRLHHQDAFAAPRSTAVGCMNKATTTLTRAGLRGTPLASH